MLNTKRWLQSSVLATAMTGLSLGTAFADAAAPAPADNHLMIPVRVLEAHENASKSCAPITGEAAPNADIESKITMTRALLDQSAVGHALLVAAEHYATGPVWVCYGGADTVNNAAVYYAGKGVLAVRDNDDQMQTIGSTLHELRHMWQEQQGFFDESGTSGLHRLGDKIDAEFILEADAEAIAVTGLWQMKEAGFTSPWQDYIDINSCEPKKVCYAPIGIAFADAAQEYGADDGRATAAAFRQWYEDGQRLYLYRWMVATRNLGSGPQTDYLQAGGGITAILATAPRAAQP